MSGYMMSSYTSIWLLIILLLAVIVRFIYFPTNVYFGYDQARDAFISQEILKGNFKVKGPPATFNPYVFHGALAYYIFAPFYFFSEGDPSAVSAFLRVYNALGVILIFLIASRLFNIRIGLLSSVFFAFSFEQSQYGIFLSHPPLAILAILVFYLGLVELIFKKKAYGLILALLGLGFSIQFHISMIVLVVVFVLNMVIFRKQLPRFGVSILAIAITALVGGVATFILSELKYHDFSRVLSGFSQSPISGVDNVVGHLSFIVSRYVNDNLVLLPPEGLWGVMLVCLFVFFLAKDKVNKQKTIFLLIWFLAGVMPYLSGESKVYYYGMGGSLALLILAGYLVYKTFMFSGIISLAIVMVVVFSNLYLVIKNNEVEFNKNIVVQEGLVIPKEKQALDYIYQQAAGENFAVNALGIPLNVATTWDYLFHWYGQQKYGYVPVWGGDGAPGYEGKLVIERKRSELPTKRFLIIEPTKHIPVYMQEAFMKEEDNFSKVMEEKSFGNIIVQTRRATN